MTGPRQFLCASAAGMLLTASLYLAAFYAQLGVAVPDPETHWISGSIQRKMSSAAKIPGPKLLLVGGSSVQFGFQAGQMERALGMPTLNMGTHAGLGLPYILHLTREAARPGDTVLLSLEYELYEHGANNRKVWATQTYVNYIVGRDAAWFVNLPIPEQFLLAMNLPLRRVGEGLRNRFSPQPLPVSHGFNVYDPQRLDDRGDVHGHSCAQRGPLDLKKLGRCEALLQGLPRRNEGFGLLEEFVAWSRTRQVRVLATFPNLCRRQEYESPIPQEAIRAIEDFYAGLGIAVLGGWQEAMLPPDAYFDTGYHLTEEGMARRTGEFVQAHRKCLQAPPESLGFEREHRISWLRPGVVREKRGVPAGPVSVTRPGSTGTGY